MTAPEDERVPDNATFEGAFTRLGEVTQGLESGGLTLEQATQLYEEGMRLAQLCNQLLSRAELRVTELRNAYSDFLADQPSQEE